MLDGVVYWRLLQELKPRSAVQTSKLIPSTYLAYKSHICHTEVQLRFNIYLAWDSGLIKHLEEDKSWCQNQAVSMVGIYQFEVMLAYMGCLHLSSLDYLCLIKPKQLFTKQINLLLKKNAIFYFVEMVETFESYPWHRSESETGNPILDHQV